MTRTDVHRPAALVTEDYEFAFCGVHKAPEGEFENRAEQVRLVNLLLEEGFRFRDVHGAEQCSHCGTRINYYAVLKHVPSKTLIHVGETCLDNRFELATGEFHKLRQAAQLDREAQRVKKVREAWAEAHPALFEFLADYNEREQTDGAWDEFYSSLWRSLRRNGELSERQAEALEKSIERTTRWADEDAEAKAEEPAPAPVLEGRIVITGKVLGLKTQESAYGETLKMLVLDDRGFKVWGTVPTFEWPEGESGLRERRMTFTSTVEASQDDPCFGFFKRPAKASLIDIEEVAS